MKFISRLRSNFCRGAAFSSVLRFGNNVVRLSVLTTLITYFIEEPNNYHLVTAAKLVIILEGISAAFGIVVAYLLDALLSRLEILICCIASTVVGLVLLTIGAGNLWVNITAVIFLAVGEGVRPQVHVFFKDQLIAHELERNQGKDQFRAHELERNQGKDQINDPNRRWWIGVLGLCSAGATLVIANYSRKVIFISSTSVLFATWVLFLCGKSYYHSPKVTGAGSSLFNFISAVKGFLLKRPQTHLLPQVKILRWPDEAAIIESSNLNQKEQPRAGPLCTATQVNESKLVLKIIPMWTTFLVFGLVASTGNTFFRVQGSEMDSTDFTFYVVVFLKYFSRVMLSKLFKFLRLERLPKAQNKLAKLMRIWIGMVLCTIFCTVAWRVEVGRLRQGKNMSIFWLVPQNCLIGVMGSCSSGGLKEFTIDELPESLKSYASAMNRFVVKGIGSLLSIFFMLANRSLFGSSLNDSRLDTYYKILTIMSFVNVCYYYFISTIYRPISY